MHGRRPGQLALQGRLRGPARGAQERSSPLQRGRLADRGVQRGDQADLAAERLLWALHALRRHLPDHRGLLHGHLPPVGGGPPDHLVVRGGAAGAGAVAGDRGDLVRADPPDRSRVHGDDHLAEHGPRAKGGSGPAAAAPKPPAGTEVPAARQDWHRWPPHRGGRRRGHGLEVQLRRRVRHRRRSRRRPTERHRAPGRRRRCPDRPLSQRFAAAHAWR
mmetsp:Transcript_112767/g.313816  ORF Transcript_112767/g.313816 Transcript_112767/m.313816 type:complete len:218 (-) Transcript_112767:48-701(-)